MGGYNSRAGLGVGDGTIWVLLVEGRRDGLELRALAALLEDAGLIPATRGR